MPPVPPSASISGMDLRLFALLVPLGLLCAFGIGRLLWLIEGKPRLDRPRWWPTGRGERRATKTP